MAPKLPPPDQIYLAVCDQLAEARQRLSYQDLILFRQDLLTGWRFVFPRAELPRGLGLYQLLLLVSLPPPWSGPPTVQSVYSGVTRQLIELSAATTEISAVRDAEEQLVVGWGFIHPQLGRAAAAAANQFWHKVTRSAKVTIK